MLVADITSINIARNSIITILLLWRFKIGERTRRINNKNVIICENQVKMMRMFSSFRLSHFSPLDNAKKKMA